MYRVSIELYKHEWKFGRKRNAVGTRAAGMFSNSFRKHHDEEKENNLLILIIKMYYVNSVRSPCVAS